MISPSRPPPNTILLPICKRDGTLLACIEELVKVVSSGTEGTPLVVLPQSSDKLDYLRLATHVYSHMVLLGKPRQDVIVRRWSETIHRSEDPAVRCVSVEQKPDYIENPANFVQIDSQGFDFGDDSPDFFDKYGVVAVGGTFDRLHAGHRLLLTAAAWAAKDVLQIGITGDCLLCNKKHRNLIASFEERSKAAVEFARKVKPSLPQILVTELRDPAGPTVSDPLIEALVVSNETVEGGRTINAVRTKSGLKPMNLVIVDIVDTTQHHKLSSSALREAEVRSATEPADG